MTGGTRLLVLVGVLIVGGARLRAQQAAPKDSAMTARTSHGWPVLGRLTRLCDGRVYGVGGSEISWEVFTSPVSMDDVLAAYRSRLANLEGGRSGDAWLFRASSGGRTTRALEIRPTPPPVLRDCPAPPAHTRTFVMFSQMMHR